MELKHYDILVPGHYFCDVVFTGIAGFPALGTEIFSEKLTVVPGGILNTIVAMRRMGLNVGWVGTLGNDFFSRYILEFVLAEGIETSLVELRESPFQHVTVSLSYPQDRAFVTYTDKDPDTIEMARQTLERIDCAHVHLGHFAVEERMPELLKMWRKRGVFVSMDCQHTDITLDNPLVCEMLSNIDLFMPNAHEALRLSQKDNLQEAAARLTRCVPFLVVKDGDKGSHAWRNGQYFYAPAPSVNVVDTTGAGDVFNSGFLAALRQGHDMTTCLLWGNVCGGLSTQGYGGCSTAPTRAEVEAYLQRG